MGAAMQMNLLEAVAGESEPNRIAEWILPRRSGDWLARSMPLLGGLEGELDGEQPGRWLTWVRPGPGPLLAGGIGRNRTRGWRQVLAGEPDRLLHCAARALAAGTSHTVVVMLEQAVEPAELLRLEEAARAGNCYCLLLRLI